MSVVSVMRGVVAVIAVVAGSITLVGCGFSGPSYADLQRDAQPADVLPTDIVAAGGIDSESARLVGEYEGTRVWLSRGSSEGSVCLVIEPRGADADVACAAAGSEIDLRESTAVHYWAVPDWTSPPDAGYMIRLSDSVYISAK
ncbi:hypothetical protein [Microbacterium sp.]|uniref:hypothetical protein n=1 Tax=Microbacterium sp. TaxID=51671 RepID=UPI003A8AD3F9